MTSKELIMISFRILWHVDVQYLQGPKVGFIHIHADHKLITFFHISGSLYVSIVVNVSLFHCSQLHSGY